MNLEERITQAIEYINYLVDAEPLRWECHYRVIDFGYTPMKQFEYVQLEKGNACISYENGHHEIFKNNINHGWGVPDIQVNCTKSIFQIRYLWNKLKPLSFEKWKTTLVYKN